MLRGHLATLLFFTLSFGCPKAFSQDTANFFSDSLKGRLATARTPPQKMRLGLDNQALTVAINTESDTIRLADTLHFPVMKINSYFRIFSMYIHDKEYAKGLDYNNAFSTAAGAGQLEWEAGSTATLADLYRKAGDFKSALICIMRSAAERDSLRTQGRATDLMKLEVDNDNRRRERQAREEELRTEHRHNIQYMGLTVGQKVIHYLSSRRRVAVPVAKKEAHVQ